MRKMLSMLAALTAAAVYGAEAPELKIEQADVVNPLDNKVQDVRFWRAEGKDPRPLVVALHTWSFSSSNRNKKTGKLVAEGYAALCRKKNFHMIYPNFRGPNRTPEALGSKYAVSDIVAAVEWAKKNLPVDAERIYIIGGSGGGHMALLMAGRHPEIWAGVSAWCPISDVALWHKQCSEYEKYGVPKWAKGYARQIEGACGAPPDPADMASRSPVTFLANAKNVPVNIGTGIHDGHTGSVPVSHTLRAFNALAAEADRFSEEDMAFIDKNEKVPETWPTPAPDPAYPKLYLRRTSGNVSVSVFEGGHSILNDAGLEWLSRQKKGQPPVWDSGKGRRKGTALTK